MNTYHFKFFKELLMRQIKENFQWELVRAKQNSIFILDNVS